MNNLILIVIGLLSGFALNFIAEWFYLRRNFFPNELEKQYLEIGILKYILWPWQWKERPFMHKLRIWLVEIFLSAGAIWIYGRVEEPIDFVLQFVLLFYFSLVVVMDIEARVVLHPVSIAGAIIGIIYGYLNVGFLPAILGGAFGFGSMFIVHWLGKKLSIYASKKRGEEIDAEPMGFGDVNLSGVLGLMLGWPGVVWGLFLGIFAGGAYSLIFIIGRVFNKKLAKYQTMPYAPFLVIGAAAIVFKILS